MAGNGHHLHMQRVVAARVETVATARDWRRSRPVVNRYLNFVLVRCERLLRYVLYLYFRFSRWHIISLRERPYARAIIDYLNSRPPEQRGKALEIGCGLGDIIRHVDFENRVGLDADNSVLRAARFLSSFSRGARTRFLTFNFPHSGLSEKYDVIVMVNWIHTIRPDVLSQKIADYARNNLFAGGAIIIDTVCDEEYPYHHDVIDLTADLDCGISNVGTFRRGREVYAITPLNAVVSRQEQLQTER
jgi:Methyltransferase domain